MNQESAEQLRETLDDCLEMIQHKLRRSSLTAGDLRAILNAITAGGGVSATVADLAELYGQSEVNVRSVIKRRVFGKPRRRVYYDFLEFSRAVPHAWHIKSGNADVCDKDAP